ncbi:MAG: methylmalonyl Co-A mutase-associated GTPase MeaB [Vulcanimicrobiaceae bacterium]
MIASNAAPTIAPAVHRDLARAITAVENGRPDARAAAGLLGPDDGDAANRFVIGITGPPGAGKSTLVDRLIEHFRTAGQTVAVIAVDPSSPFTNGAVLGDRVRMQRHAEDFGVFIRSMASREGGGGLAPATREAVALAQRARFDVVIVETVGVGQVELEVVAVADVVVVVTVPALGDGVQTIKAGLTEIADIFVVNMADRPGANRTALDLRQMVRESARAVPVLKTIASDGTGVDALVQALASARTDVHSNAARSVRFDVVRIAREAAARRAVEILESSDGRAILAQLDAGTMSREAGSRLLLGFILGGDEHAD